LQKIEGLIFEIAWGLHFYRSRGTTWFLSTNNAYLEKEGRHVSDMIRSVALEEG